MTVTKKSEPDSWKQKMAPHKNDCGEKKWATVQDKKMQFIKWLLLKKRSQTVEKNGTL